MRAMKETTTVPKRMRRMTASGKNIRMMRRAANHNLHVITPHGKILAGRKGRKG